MKTIPLNLYNYEELNSKAKERALNDWNENNDDPFMQSHMINLLSEELDERGIKYSYPNKDLDVRYSLSNSQGDGFMFEGTVQWEGMEARIKHQGHYYHSYSKTIEWYNLEGETIDPEESDREAFEALYQSVCKVMEQKGYDHIEYIRSEESFIEACEANDYTFEEDGKMRNVNQPNA